MEQNSFMTPEEVKNIGFKGYGENIQISRYARFYGAEDMEIGSHVRIDDFCILSGRITLMDHIHISAYCALYGGKAGIFMEDCSGLSARCTVYAASDDFSGGCIANAMAPSELRHVVEAPVHLERYVQAGSGTVILPGAVLKEGSAIGSMSLVNSTLEGWGIYAGVPCRFLKQRKKIEPKLLLASG